MKLSDLDKFMAGARAIRRVPLPLVNVPGPLLPDQPELAEQRARNLAAAQPGQAPPEAPPTVEVGLRVLTGEETALVYEKAWAAAKARGVEQPDERDPNYSLMCSVWTVAVACVDPDSDPDNPALFFGATPTEAAANILSSPHIGRDGIAYLAEQHEFWQDQCNPQALKFDSSDLWARVSEAVSDDPRFFLQMRPALRWSLLRSMAGLLLDSLRDKSWPGSSSAQTGTSGTSPDPKGG